MVEGALFGDALRAKVLEEMAMEDGDEFGGDTGGAKG